MTITIGLLNLNIIDSIVRPVFPKAPLTRIGEVNEAPGRGQRSLVSARTVSSLGGRSLNYKVSVRMNRRVKRQIIIALTILAGIFAAFALIAQFA